MVSACAWTASPAAQSPRSASPRRDSAAKYRQIAVGDLPRERPAATSIGPMAQDTARCRGARGCRRSRRRSAASGSSRRSNSAPPAAGTARAPSQSSRRSSPRRWRRQVLEGARATEGQDAVVPRLAVVERAQVVQQARDSVHGVVLHLADPRYMRPAPHRKFEPRVLLGAVPRRAVRTVDDVAVLAGLRLWCCCVCNANRRGPARSGSACESAPGCRLSRADGEVMTPSTMPSRPHRRSHASSPKKT